MGGVCSKHVGATENRNNLIPSAGSTGDEGRATSADPFHANRPAAVPILNGSPVTSANPFHARDQRCLAINLSTGDIPVTGVPVNTGNGAAGPQVVVGTIPTTSNPFHARTRRDLATSVVAGDIPVTGVPVNTGNGAAGPQVVVGIIPTTSIPMYSGFDDRGNNPDIDTIHIVPIAPDGRYDSSRTGQGNDWDPRMYGRGNNNFKKA